MLRTVQHTLYDTHLIKQHLLRRLGRARHLIRAAGPDPSLLVYPRSENDTLIRDNSIGEIRAILDPFLSSDLVNEPRDIEDDLFLEYLIICVRNDVISYQVHVSKQFNVTYDSLLRELTILKNCDIPDFDLIRQLEHRLNSLADQKMKKRN